MRSVFEAHDIQVLIGAEHHASMLGGLGGAFVRLDIIVDETDAEEALALLRDIRAGDHAASDDDAEPDPELPPGDPRADEAADAAGMWARERARDVSELPGASSIVRVVARRRRAAIALLASALPGFGAGHMVVGAWVRGLALGGIQLIGLSYAFSSIRTTLILSCGARALDAIGALWHVWATTPAERAVDRPG